MNTKYKRLLLMISICAVFSIVSSIVNSTSALAVGFSPRINIINNAEDIPEPTPQNTGDISWVTDRKYELRSGEEMVFEIDYDLRLFKALYVNGKELRQNSDYHLEEGSTIIGLEFDYLMSLPVGEYDVKVAYQDGQEFNTRFEVYAEADGESNDKTYEDELLVPDTGTTTMNGDGMFGGVLKVGFTVAGVALTVAFAVWVFKMMHVRLNVLQVVRRIASGGIREKKIRNSHGFKIQKKKQKIVIASFVMVLGAVIAGIYGVKDNNTDEVQALPEGISLENQLSITVSDELFEREVDVSEGDSFLYTTQDISINNATRNGYQIFISTTSDRYNDLSKNGSTESNDRIIASGGTVATPAKMKADSWGYALKNEVSEANYEPSADNLWIGVPVLGSENLVKSVEGATSAGDKTSLYYGFNVTGNLSEGSYYGTDNSAVIYTAIANPVLEYYLDYDCNGGTGSIQRQIKEAGKIAYLSDGTGCVDARRLVGWNTEADGTGKSYALGARFDDDNDLALFAMWEDSPELKTYVLQYNANGGVGAPESQTMESEVNGTFIISDGVLTRDGYSFLGWSWDDDSTVAEYVAGDTLVTLDLSNTLYAVWSKDSGEGEETIYTHTLRYDANGGVNAPGTQVVNSTGETADMEISSIVPVRDGFNFIGWGLDGSSASYHAGDLISVGESVTLFAVWESAPVVLHDFTLIYNANGGSGAPDAQSITSPEGSVSFVVSSVAPTRNGYSFLGWSVTGGASPAYHAGDSIVVSEASTTLYAVWQEILPVKVSSISISGTNEIQLNMPNHNTTLAATVYPSDAANKSVTWSSTNNFVAVVDGNGVVTGTGPGVVTIIAQANDGSGVSAAYNVVVKEKIVIVIGASQVSRFKEAGYANIQQYVSGSGRYYTVGTSSLYFVAKGGTGFDYQLFDEGWNALNQILNVYSGSKAYTEFYVYFPMAGNSIKTFTCGNETKNGDYISNTNGIIVDYANKFSNNINVLRSYGYNVFGYVVSVHPVKAISTSGEYVVANSNSNRCKKNYRSNYKYYQFNKAMMSIVNSNNNPYLNYLPLFVEIMDTSNSNQYTFKSGWTDYSTVADGIHWTNETALKYFNFMLSKNGGL